MTIENLWKKSAKDVVTLLKNNEISPKEAIDSTIHRINETHNDINAIVTTCEDRALGKIDAINALIKTKTPIHDTLINDLYINLQS